MAKYQIYKMDCYSEMGLWYENDKFHIGEIEVEDEFKDNFPALAPDYAIRNIAGGFFYPFTDLSHSYIVDYYGDGTRYELWDSDNDCPLYSFELMEE